MKTLSCLVAILLVVTAHGAETLRVVASVAWVHEEGPPMRPGVYIDLVVHAPAEFQGLPITMFAVGASRRARRAEFPIGAHFALQLPGAAVVVLKKIAIEEENIQSMIDNGVNPQAISAFIVPAQVELADLSPKPTRLEVR